MPSADASTTRVLVADDDDSIRNLLTLAFQRQKWSVLATPNGQNAIRELERFSPDVIVLDFRPVPRGGAEVLAFLEGTDVDSRRKVIVTTTSPLTGLPSASWGSRVAASLQKPFDLNELVRAVDSCRNGDGFSHSNR